MPVKQSKRYRSAASAADLAKEYPLKEAVEILAKFPHGGRRRQAARARAQGA